MSFLPQSPSRVIVSLCICHTAWFHHLSFVSGISCYPVSISTCVYIKIFFSFKMWFVCNFSVPKSYSPGEGIVLSLVEYSFLWSTYLFIYHLPGRIYQLSAWMLLVVDAFWLYFLTYISNALYDSVKKDRRLQKYFAWETSWSMWIDVLLPACTWYALHFKEEEIKLWGTQMMFLWSSSYSWPLSEKACFHWVLISHWIIYAQHKDWL